MRKIKKGVQVGKPESWGLASFCWVEREACMDIRVWEEGQPGRVAWGHGMRFILLSHLFCLYSCSELQLSLLLGAIALNWELIGLQVLGHSQGGLGASISVSLASLQRGRPKYVERMRESFSACQVLDSQISKTSI